MRSLVLVAVLGGTAHADWTVDTALRGAGSVEVGRPVDERSGVVPALAVRVLRDVGPVHVGATIATGAPAFYGEHEALASVEVEHVLARPSCGRAVVNDLGAPCSGARVSIAAGLDAGIALLFLDAPPDLMSSDDGVQYYGPRARVRSQLAVMWPTANGRFVGIAVGGGVAATRAHYMTTASGTATRVEPSVEVGLALRL